MIGPQEAFARELYHQIKDLHDLEIVEVDYLPGENPASDVDNVSHIGTAPITAFDQLPRSDEFLARFLEPPHVIAIMARHTVLAMVDRDHIDDNGDEWRAHHLVGLRHDGNHQELLKFPTSFVHDIPIYRRWIARNLTDDDSMYNREAKLDFQGTFVNRDGLWLFVDSGSISGTVIVQEPSDKRYFEDVDTMGLILDSPPDFSSWPDPVHVSGPWPQHTPHRLRREGDTGELPEFTQSDPWLRDAGTDGFAATDPQ